MFCEVHGDLLVLGKCKKCEMPSFSSKSPCIKCGKNNFSIKEDIILCPNCNIKYEIIPGSENLLRTLYSDVYTLYKRNEYNLPLWAQEKFSGDIIFIIEIHEKRDEGGKLISDGILVAMYNSKGQEKAILRKGKYGKSYRPIIGNRDDFGINKFLTSSNIGFTKSVFHEDWKKIERPFKPPFNLENIPIDIQDELDSFMTKYHSFTDDPITIKQIEFLKKLGYKNSNLEKLTKQEATIEINRLKN